MRLGNTPKFFASPRSTIESAEEGEAVNERDSDSSVDCNNLELHTVSEETSLLGNGGMLEKLHLNQSYNTALTAASHDSLADAGEDTNERKNAKKNWKKISTQVTHGEILIESALSGSRKSSHSHVTRQQVQDKIRDSLEFSSFQCMVAIALYLGLAVLAFSFVFDHWTIIDSMYFAVATFTTIGYGDISPDTKAGRVFTALFALSGVACLGIALGVIGDNMISAQKKAAEQSSNIAKNRVVSLFSSMQSNGRTGGASGKLEDNQRQDSALKNIFVELFAVVAFVVVLFVILVKKDPGVDVSSWGDIFYFAVITASTVGYGDYAPTSQIGRGISIVFIPLAVGAMGHFLTIVANWIIDGRQKRFQDEFAAHDLTLQDLEVMDGDGDGNVTIAEFLEFMLVAMNKVDQTLIDELKDQFSRLDNDGSGCLSRDDLISAARKKLQSPTRKLELARYKNSLLLQGKEKSVFRRTRKFGRSSPSLQGT